MTMTPGSKGSVNGSVNSSGNSNNSTNSINGQKYDRNSDSSQGSGNLKFDQMDDIHSDDLQNHDDEIDNEHGRRDNESVHDDTEQQPELNIMDPFPTTDGDEIMRRVVEFHESIEAEFHRIETECSAMYQQGLHFIFSHFQEKFQQITADTQKGIQTLREMELAQESARRKLSEFFNAMVT
ncbi:hypothetical protein HDU76_000201 [Blyttiomyces sp. JEL0837]|nr:hypothetical protein HDU76_000201 [Blyttiomyces sp. JEL0837]